MGRKRIELDVSKVEGYIQNGSTIGEIADYLGVSETTIRRKFPKQIARARATRRMHLRKLQWGAANDGSVSMLIFLGKQELAQGDDRPAEVEKIIVRRRIERGPPLLPLLLPSKPDSEAAGDEPGVTPAQESISTGKKPGPSPEASGLGLSDD